MQKFFEGCFQYNFALRMPKICLSSEVRGHAPEKILQNHFFIYAILVLFETIFKAIFVWNSLAFVTATSKKLLTVCAFTLRLERMQCSCAKRISTSSSTTKKDPAGD